MKCPPPVDAQVFGERVRQHRLRRGWEQKDLAQRIGRSVPTVSRIENGTLKLSLERMNAVARAFDMSLPELLRGEGGDEEDSTQGLQEDTGTALLETLYAQYEALGVTLARLMTNPDHSLRELDDWLCPAYATPALALAGGW